MSFASRFRQVLTAVLFAAFVAAVSKSACTFYRSRTDTVHYLMQQRRSGQVDLPSFTLCRIPLYPGRPGGRRKTQPLSRNLTRVYREEVVSIRRGVVIDTNQTGNMTILNGTEVLEDFLTAPPSELYPNDGINSCATYNPTERVTLASMIWFAIVFTIDSEGSSHYSVAAHHGGTYYPTNGRFAKGSNVLMAEAVRPRKMTGEDGNKTELSVTWFSLEKRRFVTFRDCEDAEEGRYDLKGCYDTYVEDHIGCVLPWRKGRSNLTLCETEQQFDAHLAISKRLLKGAARGAARLTGCLLPCDRTAYETKEVFTIWEEDSTDGERDVFRLGFYFPSTDVWVEEEMLRYGREDVVADVGGYLGLLLGGSILSFYDILVETLFWKRNIQ